MSVDDIDKLFGYNWTTSLVMFLAINRTRDIVMIKQISNKPR